MALTFDLSAIPLETRTIVAKEDRKAEGIAKGDLLMSPITNTLIISTMLVGIGEISERTVSEFADRLRLYQNAHGALMHTWNKDGQLQDRPLTREDVEAHMGLKANVPYELRAKWIARLFTKHTDVFTKPEPKCQ